MLSGKVSVIVPIYNVEEYLPRCIGSIINQTYKNLEIILVDDGSPDNCPQMCDDYAERDARIKVIHKENGGVSSARNAGLEIVTGDYIGFCDPDDWIDGDMFETLMKYATEYDADIVRCDCYLEYCDGTHRHSGDGNDGVRIIDKEQALKETLYTNTNMAIWNKLFKAYLFERERFGNKICCEDWEINYRLIKNFDSLLSVYISEPKYHYFMRGNSATHKWNERAMMDSFELFESIYDEEKNNDVVFEYACRGYAQHNISVIRDAVIYGQERSPSVKDMIKKIKEKERELKKHITSKPGKMRLIMICRCFWMYKICVKVMRK